MDSQDFIFLQDPEEQKIKEFVRNLMKEELGQYAVDYPGIRIHLCVSLYKLSSYYFHKGGQKMKEAEFDEWSESYFDPLFNYMLTFIRETKSPHQSKDRAFRNIWKRTLQQIQKEADMLNDRFATLLVKQSLDELNTS